MITAPGVYELSMEEYQADPCLEPSLSRGVIKNLLYRSPAHAKHEHPRLNPIYKDEQNSKFDVGTVAHALLLQGEDGVEVIDADDWRTKAAKEQRDKAREDGKTPLLLHQYESVGEMVKSAEVQIASCKDLGAILLCVDGKPEQSYIWSEDVWIRTRPDWISNDFKIVLDYKTTEASANPEDYARIIISNGLDIQAALYSRGVKAIHGVDPKFIFVVQEVAEPYLCSFISLSPQFLNMANQKCDYGIFLFKKCLSEDEWPAYPNRVCYLEPPAWALNSWEVRAAEVGI